MGHKTWSIRKQMSESETKRPEVYRAVESAWIVGLFHLSSLTRTLVIVFSLWKILWWHFDRCSPCYLPREAARPDCFPRWHMRPREKSQFLEIALKTPCLNISLSRAVKSYKSIFFWGLYSMSSHPDFTESLPQSETLNKQNQVEKPPPWLNTWEKYLEREDLF